MSSKGRGKGELFVVTGPSGVGKSSLVRAVLQGGAEEVGHLKFSVSYTTRPIRPGEVSGQEYHFVDEATFRAMVEQRAFLEWARVHRRFYGTARGPIEDWLSSGWDVLLDIDVQGAAQVRKSWPEARFVFVLPPVPDILLQRLKQRGTEREEEVRSRLAVARQEVTHWEEFDYVIVNDQLAMAARELAAVILEKRIRRERCSVQAAAIVAAFDRIAGERE